MAQENPTKNLDTRAGDIKKFEIIGNKTNTSKRPFVDVSAGVVEITYYESILANTTSLKVVIVDTGNKKGNGEDKEVITKGLLDELPIRGGEECRLEIVDAKANPNTLTFKDDNALYVNRVLPIGSEVHREVIELHLCPKELLSNEQTRVVKRYNGKISDSVGSILRDVLEVKKDIIVDPTLISYNFIGNDRKPLYVCTWLASKSVPEKSGKKNAAAGYFFYETYSGFNFRSIDGLFDQKYKRNGKEVSYLKKYLYNEQATLPESGDYDESILNYSIERNIDLHQNLTLGTYSNRSIFFDFYSSKYREREYSYDDYQKEGIKIAGRDDIDFVADEFRKPVSRLMNHVLDVGTLPPGKDATEQLKNWKNTPFDPTFDATNTLVQSIMRYNQIFSIKINITIAGDFSLRAGDLIYCDFPHITGGGGKTEVNEQSGGIYLISSLCHRITPSDTYTSLTLVRDSFGRKPF